MYCTKCGAEIIAEEPFCLFCGLDSSGETPLSVEKRVADQTELEATAYKASSVAHNVRSERKIYLFVLSFFTLVAAGAILFFTWAWNSKDPEMIKARPHVTSIQYFLILYCVVLGIWLIVYLSITIHLSSAFPKGTYSWALELALTMLGIVPGIIYMLVVAHGLIAKAPDITPIAAAPFGPGNQNAPPLPPPPKLPRGSRKRRSVDGRKTRIPY